MVFTSKSTESLSFLWYVWIASLGIPLIWPFLSNSWILKKIGWCKQALASTQNLSKVLSVSGICSQCDICTEKIQRQCGRSVPGHLLVLDRPNMHARMCNFTCVEPRLGPLKYPPLASFCIRRVLGLEISSQATMFLCSWTNLKLPGFSIHTLGVFTVHPLDLYHFLWYVDFLLECIPGHFTNLIGSTQVHRKAREDHFLLLVVLLIPSLAGFRLSCLWSELVKVTHQWAFLTLKQLFAYVQREFKGNVGLVFLRIMSL